MNAIEVFAILQKKIKSALSGIARIEETPTGFKIITNDGNSFSYTIPNFHKHDNKTDILDKFSLDSDGKLLFDGQPIVSEDEGGSGKLKTKIVSNIEVGGVSKNTTFDVDTNYDDIFQKLFVKYLQPAISSITLNPSQDKHDLMDIGDNKIVSLKVTPSLVKNSEPIAKSEIRVGGVLANTNTSIANGGSYTYTHGTTITTTDCVKINDALYTLEVKVTVNDSKSSVSSTKSTSFVCPHYYGSVDVVPTTEGEIKALTKELLGKVDSKDVKYTHTNKYTLFAYPKVYGNVTSIIDQNNFENIDSFNRSEVTLLTANGDSIVYNVYTATSKNSLSNFKYTFKI